MRGRLAITAILVLLAAGCAPTGGSSSPGASMGSYKVSGIVLASPGCPGPQRIDQPCPDKPVAGGSVELLAASAVVASTATGPDGRFELDAAAGTYTLTAHNVGYRSQASQDIDVTGPVEVTLTVDSGMR